MNFFVQAFNVILYQPLFNALIFLYQVIPGQSFGLAVIALTVLIRLLLYPLNAKSIKSQQAMSEIQPKIKEIQNKYEDKEEQAQKMMELYQEKDVNPFSGCLPLLLQLPVLIVLIRIFRRVKPDQMAEQMNRLYSFVAEPASLNMNFLGVLNLAEPHSVVLVVLAVVLQYFQMKMANSGMGEATSGDDQKSKFANMFQNQMKYLFPVMIGFFVWTLPSAVGLYWVITIGFMLGQQYYIKNSKQKTE